MALITYYGWCTIKPNQIKYSFKNQFLRRSIVYYYSFLTCILYFPAQSWSQSCLFKASRCWSHISLPCALLGTSCAAHEYLCAIWCYLHIFAEKLQMLVTEFSPSTVSGFFVAWWSSFDPVFIAGWSKKRCVNESMGKMQ